MPIFAFARREKAAKLFPRQFLIEISKIKYHGRKNPEIHE
jgi:hypothetical protein